MLKNAIFVLIVLTVLTVGSFAQSEPTKAGDSKPSAAAANTQIVDARQSGTWTVGIDSAKNVVGVQNASTEPLNVAIVNTNGRQPFQIAAGMQVFAGGPSSATEQILTIPAGKRFVIENITASCEIPNGESITLSFLSRIDITTPGTSMYQYIDVHSQGVFGDKIVLTANHRAQTYAAYQLPVRARPTWTTGTGYANVTFSGYLENLPTAP